MTIATATPTNSKTTATTNLPHNFLSSLQCKINPSFFPKIHAYITNKIYTNSIYKYDPIDIDHSGKLKLALIFIFETCSIVFMYFSILTLQSLPIYPNHNIDS